MEQIQFSLAICIGFMNAFDMGGPVTKTVSMFTLALMNEVSMSQMECLE
ncbi:hypothetical protein [Caldifermentibacillus hisashii]|nr:hypothetical protein [Caldifermentibacillus hisashii]